MGAGADPIGGDGAHFCTRTAGRLEEGAALCETQKSVHHYGNTHDDIYRSDR